MKHIVKILLEEHDYQALKQKAESLFPERAAIPKYIRKIAQNPIAFLDQNVIALFKVLNFEPKGTKEAN